MSCPANHPQSQCPFPNIDASKLFKIPIPPMKYFGLLGHLPQIDRDFPVSSLWKLMDAHGPILETDLQGRRILVGNHELFKEMLDEDTWVKQPSKAQLELRNVGGGDGLVTAFSGEKNWGIARRLLNPSFGPLGLRNMFDDMLEISSQLVLMWDRYGPDNEIECVDAFTRLTFDTIGLCAFNVRFNEFYMKEVHPFVKHLSEGLIECGRRANRPQFLNTLLFYGAERERQANMKRMRELSDQIVRDWEANPRPGATSTDFLNVLLYGVDKETGEKVPKENVRYQIATFLAAGYDTTASSLAFVYYYLCDNPDCLRKAQKEVDEVVGDKVVTVNMLSRLTYLKACLQESLRLNSPVNILNRDATKDTVLGGKYLINKGLSVSCLLRHLHRDPKVWGDDADEFRPERMLNGGFESLPASAWKPFGNGSRVCIGQGFAEQEMLISLSQVLQRFYIQKADPSYKLVLRSTLTTKPADFKMKVRRRPDRTILVGIPGGVTAESVQKQQPRQRERTSHLPGKAQSVCVFVGGNMGTSEGLAHDLAEKAPDFGLEVEIRDLDAAVENLPTDRPCIIITASYEGKPPDNARKFVAWIEQLSRESGGKLPKSTRYAVFGVGNSDWASTFHRIPKLVDDTLSKLGADRIIQASYSNVKLDIMGPWEEWSEQLCVSLSNSKSRGLQVSVGLEISIEKNATNSRRRPTQSGEEMSNATIFSNRELADASVGAAKRHVEILLPPGWEFVPGDYLVIQGRNPEEAVRRVLARFDLGRHDVMSVKASKKNFLPREPRTVGHFLSTSVELATPITRRQLSTLVQWAEKSNGEEHVKLQKMLQDEVYETMLEKRYSIIDVLEDVPGLRLPFGVYVDFLLPLTPRQYSISSAPEEAKSSSNDKEHGLTASITFDFFEAPAMSGHGTFRGVVSNFLSACRSGDRIQCVVRPNTIGFCLPSNSETPMIMVAAGTGIAPIRAFIAKRAAIKQNGVQKLGPAILFFGCRNAEKDYIYRSELEEWERQGVVEVVACFSKPRDGGQRGRHVPEALWESRERVWSMLQNGGRIYVCGSAARLGRSSADMLKRIYIDRTEKSELEADDWLDEIKTAGSYIRDVY